MSEVRSAVPSSASAGRIHDAGLPIGVLNAHFAFETIGIAPEKAEEWTEIGDEVIGNAFGHEAIADRFECLERLGLQGQVVDATPAEHRGLLLVLGIAFDLEDIEFGPLTEFEHGQTGALAFGELGTITYKFGFEDLGVERNQPIEVRGDERNVIDSLGEHGLSQSEVRASSTRRSARATYSGSSSIPT